MTLAAVPFPATSPSQLQQILRRQRMAFQEAPMPSLARRRQWLNQLARMLSDHQDRIIDAIHADFSNRPAQETRLLELFPCLEAINYARRHLKRWMRAEQRHVSMWFQPGSARVEFQPLGVVGVISPWNYPLYLTIGPLVAALAAGNRVMIKTSEYSPHFTDTLAELIEATFPEDLVTVVKGDVDVAQAFSKLPFDHLLFTGSTQVGQQVMAAAAKNLTPVTLELGGKSPVLVMDGYNIALAAKRIMFGKLVNAGQTCVAPDYVLLPAQHVNQFVDAARKATQAMYASTAHQDFTAIASPRHYQRQLNLLQDARDQGAQVISLLEQDADGSRKIAPTIVLNGSDNMQVMQEEIFGPILPVVTYQTEAEALEYINRRGRPLALYLFDDKPERVQRVLAQTASGGVTVNDCNLHVAQDDLPFGGVGASGMGRYHGPEGFKTFSQQRAVFQQARLSSLPLLYPPYHKTLARVIVKAMLWFASPGKR